MKLEDFIAKRLGIGRRAARDRILEGRIRVDGRPERERGRDISRFERVEWRDECLQEGRTRLYLMLHKPAGVLSATSDPVHPTVLDLIDHPDRASLHLAGRLDRSSTGLILLSNDGNWSAALSHPEAGVEKVYRVETDRPIPPEAVSRFAEGFYFSTEGIKTRPARLEINGECLARVTLQEGRYHQIKRMFHRIDGLRLLSLHRESIGPYRLPGDLAPGEWRPVDPADFVQVAGITAS